MNRKEIARKEREEEKGSRSETMGDVEQADRR